MRRLLFCWLTLETSWGGQPLAALKIEPHSVQLNYLGERTTPLRVVSIWQDGSTHEPGEAVKYTSESSRVATVDQSGVVTAVAAGKTRIIVETGGLSAAVAISIPKARRGDLNADGKVDTEDLKIIQSALNSPARSPVDARDLNRDGKIDALDLRILTTLCTYSRCAVHP